MSPNELFCAVLHDETCRIMREFFEGEDPAFGNMWARSIERSFEKFRSTTWRRGSDSCAAR